MRVGALVRSCVAMLTLSASTAMARSDLRDLLGALLPDPARQAAVAQAQQAWARVDPRLLQCLADDPATAPAVLAANAVHPNDPRLAGVFGRCRALIAEQEEQRRRDAAAAELERQRQLAAAAQRQQAEAEAARRRQADADAARAERERKQAEAEAAKAAEQRKQAEAQAARAAHARRMAEEQQAAQQRAASFASLQQSPELQEWIGRPDSDFVVLRNARSKRLVVDLNAKLATVGEVQPVMCWLVPTTGASSEGFFRFAMAGVREATSSRSVSLVPCGALGDPRNADLIVFNPPDVTPESAEIFEAVRVLLQRKEFVPLVTVTQSSFDADQAAKKARAQEIERAVDDGASGFGVVQIDDASSMKLCTVAGLDDGTIGRAMIAASGDAGWPSTIAASRKGDTGELFVALKAGGCTAVLGDADAVRKIRGGLRRDNGSAGILKVWLGADDVARVRQRLEAERRTRAEAERRAEDEAATREATERKAKAEAVARAEERVRVQQAEKARGLVP